MAEPLDAQSQAAIAAALAIASGEGVRVIEPRVVGFVSNRIIWLWPAPIVARVMSGTAVLHADPRAWLAREVDLGTFLARSDAPIVPPASSVDPGPHISGGLWMSFWEHVEVVPADVSARGIGEILRSLHDAMVHYPGALPSRSAVVEEIDWLLTALGEPTGEDEVLLAERDRLAPLLAEGNGAGQPLQAMPRSPTSSRRVRGCDGTTSRMCAVERRHGTSSGSSTTPSRTTGNRSRSNCYAPTGVTSTRRSFSSCATHIPCTGRCGSDIARRLLAANRNETHPAVSQAARPWPLRHELLGPCHDLCSAGSATESGSTWDETSDGDKPVAGA